MKTLDDWNSQRKEDSNDMKKNPGVYIWKAIGILIWALGYHMIMNPLLTSFDLLLSQLSAFGFLTIIVSTVFRFLSKLHSVFSLFSADLLLGFDNVVDIKRISKFYALVFMCLFFAKNFATIVHENLKPFYGRKY